MMHITAHNTENKKNVFRLTLLSAVLAISGCGGDGFESISPGAVGSSNDTGSDEKPLEQDYQVTVTTSVPTLTTGSGEMSVTIVVTDSNGGTLAGVPVDISLENSNAYGLVLNGASKQVTDDNGQVTINVRQTSAPSNQTSVIDHRSALKVTVDDGFNDSVTETLPIEVTGTTISNVRSAKQSLTKAEKTTVIGILQDGTGNLVTGVKAQLLNNGSPVEGQSTISDDNGEISFKNIQAKDLVAEDGIYDLSVQLMAENKGVEVSQVIDLISLISIEESAIDADYKGIVLINRLHNVIIRDRDNPSSNKPVTLTTSRGFFEDDRSKTSVTKNMVNGEVTFTLAADNPGEGIFSVDYEGKTINRSISFVAIEAQKVLLQPEKSQLSRGESTKVIARVLDDRDAPIKNAVVEFNIAQGASGGTLSSASAITDADGVATVTYTVGNNPTGQNNVEITAKVSKVRYPGKVYDISPAISTKANITAQANASFISFGFADKVIKGDREVYYFRNASVTVVNAQGMPAANQDISISYIPEKYYKGFYSIATTGADENGEGGEEGWVICYDGVECPPNIARVTCDSEDKDNDGILDKGEDYNGNGQLEPGNRVAILDPSVEENSEEAANSNLLRLKTDRNGRADFQVRYFKGDASWFDGNVVVSTKVDGSEFRSERPVYFPALVDDIDISVPIRPNWDSPFGEKASCSSGD